MNLSESAYRHRPVVFLIVAILMAFGAYSYMTLPAREDPAITVREAVVTTTYPGLSAERMERLVTRTIEEAVREVEEVDEVRSTSMPGTSIIHVEVHDRFFDLDQIWDEVADRIEDVRPDLPDGANPPVLNDDFGDVSVVTAALLADDWDMADKYDAAKHVRDRLYATEGVKKVEIVGQQEERIWIEVSNARLSELGVDHEDVILTLRNQNVIRPGGQVDAGGRGFIIEPTGDYRTVEDLGDTLIRLPEGQLVALRDLGEVRRGYADPPQRKAYYDGREAVIFAISMLEDQRVLDFGPRVRDRLSELESELPVGYEIELITYQAAQVEKAVYGVTFNVLQTLVIVLGVVVLFLGVRTGLIVGAIVPIVMLGTVAVMGMLGMTLERMSLATLVIALGLLVDNGIVVAEDTMTRLGEGTSRDDALKETSKELSLPLLASTLTTVLVFLPLMLSQHVASEYARSISLVVLIALSLSWVAAMTVTPILCHRFVKPTEDGKAGAAFSFIDTGFERLNDWYRGILKALLRVRIAFLVVMGVLLVVAMLGVREAPKRFFPESDRAQLSVYVDLPAGVTARTTDERIGAVSDRIAEMPYVEDVAGYVAFGGPRFLLSLAPIDPQPNKGVLIVNVTETKHLADVASALREMTAREFPDQFTRVAPMFLGPSDSTKLEVQVKGPDADTVFAFGKKIEDALAEVEGTTAIRQDWQNRTAKIVVEVDQARARLAGVSSADVARAMNAYFSGERVSQFREGDDVFPIIARAADADRNDLGRVRTLPVAVPGSPRTVPLEQVADIRLENEYARIQREDLVRTVTVEASNLAMSAEDMVPLVTPKLDTLRAELPAGHEIEYDGIVAESGEGRAALLSNFPLTLGIIVVLLVMQFGGFKRPVIILATIPLVVIGASLALWVLGANFGLFVILGLMALAGIIINNAIVLIDRIDIERADEDTDDFEALTKASVRRLRPILVTTITTIVGLLPLILSGDPLFFGMAGVIAFGLAVGTVLTLGVVPVLYAMFFGIDAEGERENEKAEHGEAAHA